MVLVQSDRPYFGSRGPDKPSSSAMTSPRVDFPVKVRRSNALYLFGIHRDSIKARLSAVLTT